jgi:predicted pyridoxine 5'-phosphate oxidase superfamily flavin-nucleotide-binding protein
MPSNSGGHGTITDFQIGHDEIDLEGFFNGASDPNFTQLMNDLSAAANGVHDINLGNNQTITLQNVNVNALHASDFIVHSQSI